MRRILVVLTTTAALAAIPVAPSAATHTGVVLQDDPVAYWRLDDAAGVTADDAAGSLDGAYVGNPQPTGGLAATSSGAARFDGVGDAVAVPDSSLVNLSLRAERSIELWFRADGVTNRQVLYEEGGGLRGLNLYIRYGRVYWSGWNLADDPSADTPWALDRSFVSAPISANRTYHVVLTMDRAARTITGYLDGEVVGHMRGVGYLYPHGSDIGIGGMLDSARFYDGAATGDGHWFDGVIDEVAIYNDALTAAQVRTHYEAGAGTPGDPPPPPPPPPPPGGGNPWLMAAGDIANCGVQRDERIAELIGELGANRQITVAPLGDLAYPNGSPQDFANCYEPGWGRHKAITKPAPGNHEYYTPGAAGYFGYFGSAAGDPSQGWYAYDLGTWRVLVLNSNCGEVGCHRGSPQETWLRQQLAASPRCTVAYFHHPRFVTAGNPQGSTSLWQAIYDGGVDVVLNGHAHYYARSAKLRADGTVASNGVRQLIAGTGGNSLHPLPPNPHPGIERRIAEFGVLGLELRDSSYRWEFYRWTDGQVLDSGTTSCT